MNTHKAVFQSFVAGFLGASLALYGPSIVRDAWAYAGGPPMNTNRLTLEDAAGRRLASLERTADGGSSLFFFDPQDRSRMEVGTYGDGLPFVVMEGDHHTPKALLRMAGSNQSGVLVFKDKQNRDRMVLGLDMNDPSEEPFLMTFDKEGHRKMIFGKNALLAH